MKSIIAAVVLTAATATALGQTATTADPDGATMTVTTAAPTAAEQDATNGSESTSNDELKEVVVTGTLIRGAAPIGTNLTTLSGAAITATGATNVTDVLASVPALNGFNISSQGGPSVSNSGQAQIPALHELPGTATLVLVDGHRLVGDSPLMNSPDPSSIPPSAIDHIEVMDDGGSAIYGSDAVAGVVNIILKDHFDGAETNLSYGKATSNPYNTNSVQQNFGKVWSGGSAFVAGMFERNSELQNKDLSFYQTNLAPFGGTDYRTKYCPSANIQIGSQTYAPPSYAGGAPALCDSYLNNDIYFKNYRWSLVGTVRQDVGSRVHLSFDAKYSDQLSRERITDFNQIVTIPNTNPFFVEPPGSTATSETAYWDPSNLGTVYDEFRTHSGWTDFGATVDLGASWELRSDLDYSWSSSATLNPQEVNPVLLPGAENGTTTSTALDPFGNGTNPSLAAQLLNWPLYFYGSQKL